MRRPCRTDSSRLMKPLCSQRPGGATEALMVVALALMVALVFGNVVARHVFSTGFAAAEELARLLFVWLVFLGAIVALREQRHLGLDLLQARLPGPLRRLCAVISHALMLWALALFAEGSWQQSVIGLRTYSTVLGFPQLLVAGAGLVSALAMAGLVARNLWWILAHDPRACVPGQPAAANDGDGDSDAHGRTGTGQ